MPTYEFKCSENPEHKYQEIRGINDPQVATTCAEEGCEGRLIRVFGTPPITFKGTGFSAKRG
jgi:predicted nucleic acid-binding Zn ribbon protein